MQHLFGRALEQTPATGGKQGVSAKQNTISEATVSVEGDMTERVSRDMNHLEAELDTGWGNVLAIMQGLRHAWYVFRRRTPYGNLRVSQQVMNATDVICVVVGD